MLETVFGMQSFPEGKTGSLLLSMLKQNVGFGASICCLVTEKIKAGLSVDYQTFNLMYKSQDENFSIPNLTQNKRPCFESTNAPFS